MERFMIAGAGRGQGRENADGDGQGLLSRGGAQDDPRDPARDDLRRVAQEHFETDDPVPAGRRFGSRSAGARERTHVLRRHEEGYGGLGTFYVFSAGNGFDQHDWATLDEHNTHHGVTAVCSVNDRGVRSAYSEVGPSLWVCAPSDDDDEHGTKDLFTTAATFGSGRPGTWASIPTVSGRFGSAT